MVDIADLPESLRRLVEREERPALIAAGAVEFDLPENIYKATRWLAKQPVPPDGGGEANETLFRYAAMLRDYGLSQGQIELMLETHTGYGRIPDTVASAFKNGKNEQGARATTYGVEEVVIADPPQPGELGGKPKGLLGRGCDVKDRAVTWLWPGWIARGKFEVFGGGKGAGKSTIGYDLAARLTSGGQWPDGSPVGRPRDFLVWSGEDDIEDTIMPRFKVAGGDPDRLYYVDNIIVDGKKRVFDPAIDMSMLIELSREIPDLGMIQIDPVVSAVAGDSHKNAETRRGLQPLADLAKARDASLIGITHFTKGTQGRNPVERITGSLAFGALPRIVFGAVKGEDTAAPRSFVRIASNIGPDGGGFEYTLQQQPVPGRDYLAQRVVWGKPLQGDATTLLGNTEQSASKFDFAVAWLTQFFLNEPGHQASKKEVTAGANANGINPSTLQKAMEALPIKAVRNLGATTGWNWKWIAEVPELW